MANDFQFSKDYPALWREARRISNIDRMQEIFDEMIAEVGGPNAAYIAAAGAEQGKRAAEYMNIQHGTDPTARGGKKV